ncbi:hypothetical protein D9757_009270 [Collybiopsis confluens]|uniref:Uncharacterized protein n=1 Tax=Collybiopsis confluens TaxID=2823264 RepID=A0A8H5HA67_9AGAR|nr:hypothetical protein D9757_009270 [Collybiopsis confluens]
MTYSTLSSSIPTATGSQPYGHEHEHEKHHEHHTMAPPSTTTVTVSATAVPPSSTASSSVPGFEHIFQTVGSETVITFTSTILSSSVFTTTSDGRSVPGTTVVPVTTTILPTPTNKASLPAPLKSRSNPLVPVIIGSLVGALALLGVGIFLYIRRRRRRRSMFHKMSNPLIDIEETVSIQPPQQPVLLGTQSRLDAETRTRRGQSPRKIPLHHDHENVLVPTPADNNPDRDRASNVRSQMEEMRTEMRVTMGRMMEHVQRIEAQIVSGRDGEGLGDLESVTLDGRPPTYVSS